MSAPTKSVLDFTLLDLLCLNGAKLAAIRQELGLHPDEMASKLNCHSSTLNRYENEKTTIPVTLIHQVKALLDAERAARRIRLAPDPAEGCPPEPVLTWPIALARGRLSPGTKLVELVPVQAQLQVTRMFAAVEGAEPPSVSPDEARESLPPRPRVRRAAGQFDHALATAFAVLLCFTGCLRSWQVHGSVGGAEQEQQPDRVSDQFPTEDANEEQAPKHSIKMPKKPYPWQKLAPCGPGEVEKTGGCWAGPFVSSPCPSIAVEEAGGQCFVPIPAPPKRPSTSGPQKP